MGDKFAMSDESWRAVLGNEFTMPYYAKLMDFVRNAYTAGECYPPFELIFNAFELTPFARVKAVIVGQDPYHEPGQAQGLAFYVPPSVKTPPSLVNISREVGRIPDLLNWARQGVLLLNDTLTVSAHRAGSHRHHGWEQFTDAVIERLSSMRSHLVFMLWGNPAIMKCKAVDRSRHLVLTAPHPSPLSAYRGFFGCKHFTKCNEYLVANNIQPIAW